MIRVPVRRTRLLAVLAAGLAASTGCGRARQVSGAAVAECGGCHGAPPATGAHLVHASSAGGAGYGTLHVLEDVAPSGGPSYDFGCGHCHPLDPAEHGAHVAPPVGGARVPDVMLDPAGAGACSSSRPTPAPRRTSRAAT